MREDMKLFFGSAFGVFVGSNGLGDNAESIDSWLSMEKRKKKQRRDYKEDRCNDKQGEEEEWEWRERERYRRDFLISDFWTDIAAFYKKI